MTPIEQKEIRGLTMKQFITLMVTVCSIIFAVAVGYTKIVNKIEESTKQQDETNKRMDLIDTRIQTIQTTQQKTDVWQGRIEERLNKDK